MKRYVVVGGEPELALLLHIFPQGVEELDGAYAVYADEPPLGFDVLEVEDVAEGWEEAWRGFHHGVVVGRFWVGPPWEEAPPDVEAIVIDPGRAFGTGAHATTRLCLELLQTLEPGSLLDVGCGSGVLGIAAARLGFAPVVAVDAEPETVGIARANAAVNAVALEVRHADALVDELPRTDVAVANIALEPVQRVLARLESPLALVSGYLERDEPSAPGWRRLERRDREGWAADLLERA